MAKGGDPLLTNQQIHRLGRVISRDDMESFALGYLDIDNAIIKTMKREETGEAFNREVICHWRNKNPKNQILEIAKLLYQAAKDGYVNPHKVAEILEVTEEEVTCPTPEQVPPVPKMPQLSEEFSRALRRDQSTTDSGLNDKRGGRTFSFRQMWFRDLKLETLTKDLLQSLVHIVKILHGQLCTMIPRHSRVILHIPHGLHGVILGNIHHNFKTFRHYVKNSDCIVGPMCEFEFHSYDDIPRGAWIKIEVPHIVKNPNVDSRIKVIYRDRYQDCIEHAQKLGPGQEPADNVNTYYRYTEKCIEIFAHHFSQFVVYAKNTTLEEVWGRDAFQCCNKGADMFVFTKWIRKTSGEPLLDIVLYMCSLHYEGKDYKQEMINQMKNEGRILIGHKEFLLRDQPYDPRQISIEVRFITSDESGKERWMSTNPCYRLKLEEVFTYNDGHICRSEPKALQNVYLVPMSKNNYRLRMEIMVTDQGEYQVYGLVRSVSDPPMPAGKKSLQEDRVHYGPGMGVVVKTIEQVTLKDLEMGEKKVTKFSSEKISGPKLTEEKLFKLSYWISSKEELDRLAAHLEMTNEMEEYQEKESNIATVTYMTLTSWVQSQPDHTSAHRKLCQALEECCIEISALNVIQLYYLMLSL